ncbi:Gfo/Idh/MocA family protein [Planctomicrobium sp. SH664]|uniref:Gfo/Idh/MocA family protein n=1 Tax=Planctomicrobium sp. SH664 TaxID=3448125 RepID=UPI003F5ADF3C
MNRRSFLETATVAGSCLAFGGFRPVSAAAAGRLNVAAVGVGGKGASDLKQIAASPYVDIVAICDVDDSEGILGRAATTFPKAKHYTDWRKMLEQKDIDAVQVSTPDHMHAPISLAAIALGKHVYCQKPLSHTIFEARVMTQAAAKAGVVTQMGNQIQSHPAYRTATKLVHDGTIGKVKEVHSWQSGSPAWRKWKDRPTGQDPVPASLDWDGWLGVAAERPFVKDAYHRFNWRNWQDFGTGQLGDFGCHIFDPVFTSLKLTAPLSLTSHSTPFNGEVWPDAATVEYIFPGTAHTADSTIKVTWYDGAGTFPPREKLGVPDDYKLPNAGSVLIGEEGVMVIPHYATPQLFPREKFPQPTVLLENNRDHYLSWVNACRGEDKTTSAFSYSGPLTEAVLLGTIANRFPDQKLEWNSADLRITNVADANQWLSKPYRRGWELPVI